MVGQLGITPYCTTGLRIHGSIQSVCLLLPFHIFVSFYFFYPVFISTFFFNVDVRMEDLSCYFIPSPTYASLKFVLCINLLL